MEKDVEVSLSSIGNYIIIVLTFAALAVVFMKASRDYSVTDIDSPNLVLAILSALPYFITFVFSFFSKTENHRKSFYASLGILFFMTGFEWFGPRTSQMRDVYSVIWFFQTVFVVPFLIYAVRSDA